MRNDYQYFYACATQLRAAVLRVVVLLVVVLRVVVLLVVVLRVVASSCMYVMVTGNFSRQIISVNYLSEYIDFRMSVVMA
jgi:hypothetical protein